ncbi:MAG: hypothetical protein U0325_31670 [Polyangiales bacterium]
MPDDIMAPQFVCGSCVGTSNPTMNCTTLRSSLEGIDVVPGDVVQLLAVNGYHGATGSSACGLGENPAAVEPLFATPPTGITAVNRCTCQGDAQPRRGGDVRCVLDGTMDAVRPLVAGSSVLGARMVPRSRRRHDGAALVHRRAGTTDTTCVGTTIKATFDLYAGNFLVTSASVRTPLLTPTTVTVPLTTSRR